MKKGALGLVELLIVVVLIIILYFTCFRSQIGNKNPFADSRDIKSHQEFIDEKVQEIENTKLLKQRIESNLKEGI